MCITMLLSTRKFVCSQVLAGFVVLVGSTFLSGSVGAVPKPDQEMIPKATVLRLLKCPGDCVKNMQLLVGRLPDNFLVKLPLPTDAKIVATIIRDQDRSEVVLDSPQSPQQIKAFYTKSFIASGWKTEPSLPEAPGFLPSLPDFPYTRFCQSEQGPEMTLSANKDGNEPTDVRLYFNLKSENCAESDETAEATPDWQDWFPIPSLTPPEDSEVSQTDLSPQSDMLIASAQVTTKKSQEALLSDYSSQLVKAGWRQQNQTKTEQSTSSFLIFKDKKGTTWQGMLKLSPIEDQPNDYAATLLVWR